MLKRWSLVECKHGRYMRMIPYTIFSLQKRWHFVPTEAAGRHTYRDARASGIRGKKEFVRGPPLRAPIQRALKEGGNPLLALVSFEQQQQQRRSV